jgi:hypothetical protein
MGGRGGKTPLYPLPSSKSNGWRGASSAFLYMLTHNNARVLIYFTCFLARFSRYRDQITQAT